METCKNCKWWGVSFNNDCEFVNTIHASSESVRFEIEEINPCECNSKIVLKTGPDFGCIHFKQKA